MATALDAAPGDTNPSDATENFAKLLQHFFKIKNFTHNRGLIESPIVST